MKKKRKKKRKRRKVSDAKIIEMREEMCECGVSDGTPIEGNITPPSDMKEGVIVTPLHQERRRRRRKRARNTRTREEEEEGNKMMEDRESVNIENIE